MRTTGQIRSELQPDLEASEREELVALALRLEATVPAPPPGFPEALRERLLPRRLPAPPRRALAAAYAIAGSLLLAIAAAGLAGIGPFGAG